MQTLSVLLAVSILSQTTLFAYADTPIDSGTAATTATTSITSDSGSVVTDSGSYNTGNPSLDKVFRTFDGTLRKGKDTTRLAKFLTEGSRGKERTISDATRDEILANQASQSKKAKLQDELATQFGSGSAANQVLTSLLSSIKKADKGTYRLFIKSTLSESEITDLFAFFDNVTLKKISTGDDGKTLYELTFSSFGRLAKTIGKGLDSGEIPTSLFDGIETVEPVAVKGLVSTGSYLSGETLTSLWGQVKMGATNYQYGLTTAKTVKVGIIDTGIDFSHSDLASHIATNTGEIAGNGKDDDGNGYIDDVQWYNFVAGTNNAADDHWHGTHVAGITAGIVNGKGVFGVDSSAKLVPLKVLSANGYGSSYAIVDAINYAANNGIRVVNMSLGGTGTPTGDIICNAITAAKNKGTISVVAAGNENADVSTKVPAGCTDAITVGAVDSTLTKASFSNYGSKVDVAAPGVNIYSSYPTNSYATMNGTSMATPFVTGLVAAMVSYNSSLTTDSVRTILKNNTLPVTSSVNIGGFASMSKVMAYMGVKDDSQLNTGSGSTGSGSTGSGSTGTGATSPGTGSGSTGSGSTGSGSTSTGTVSTPPTLSLATTKVSTNVYKVTATATATGGATIASYAFYNGSVLLYSGATNSYQLTITANTTITVKVTDSKKNSTSASTTLAYVAPTNQAPVVNLSFAVYNTYYNRTTIAVSDADGTIAKVNIYITSGSATYTYTLAPNTAKTTLLFDSTKGTQYTFRVVATDNKGATTEKSITVK